ncbi:hypothetical protein [Saccharomonospora xinjiangensis]|uniref:Uncharacterized protein n=1 Tax=Saccharomonospora xinjiangensis XJ-54 TaxID=882086 RepID=I0UZR5_9PSEU|nr:hypothetical protein [Saccharomonospora xinjiangensis]EID53368.1 hypothetical protein SacxiDRAFT_1109 [Saccharomonospora xinjiangensis XJ-54]
MISSTTASDKRRGVWFPLVALAVLVLGSVAATLIEKLFATARVPSGHRLGEGELVGTGYPDTASAVAVTPESAYGAMDEYWLFATVVCWSLILAWYRGSWSWRRTAAVGIVVPLGFVLGVVFVAADVTGGDTGLTAPALLFGLTVLAGGWARVGSGRGHALAVAVCVGLAAALAFLGASAVVPEGAAVLLVGGVALAWFARSRLVAVATVAAVAALAWLPGPVLAAAVAAALLVALSIASRHPRLRHV